MDVAEEILTIEVEVEDNKHSHIIIKEEVHICNKMLRIMANHQ